MKDKSQKRASINHWNDAGAPDKPKGILQNRNKSSPGPGQNTVLHWSVGFTGNCQYSLLKSSVENMIDPDYLVPHQDRVVGTPP